MLAALLALLAALTGLLARLLLAAALLLTRLTWLWIVLRCWSRFGFWFCCVISCS